MGAAREVLALKYAEKCVELLLYPGTWRRGKTYIFQRVDLNSDVEMHDQVEMHYEEDIPRDGTRAACYESAARSMADRNTPRRFATHLPGNRSLSTCARLLWNVRTRIVVQRRCRPHLEA